MLRFTNPHACLLLPALFLLIVFLSSSHVASQSIPNLPPEVINNVVDGASSLANSHQLQNLTTKGEVVNGVGNDVANGASSLAKSPQFQNQPTQEVANGASSLAKSPEFQKNLPTQQEVANGASALANSPQLKNLPPQQEVIAGVANGASSLGMHLPAVQEVINGLLSGTVQWGNTSFNAGGPIGGHSTIILAAERTHRKDPLDGYKRYTGGWNLTNEHYWSSLGFTAFPLFAFAIVWFLAFGLTLLLLCCCCCCCRRKPYGYSRIAYALSLILLILFTIAAIIGCAALYTGQGKFHASTSDVLKYVVNQANTTFNKLRNVANDIASAKSVHVRNTFLPSDIQTKIDTIGTTINTTVNMLSDTVADTSDKIQTVLDKLRVSLIVLSCIMLLLAFIGFLLSIFGMQAVLYILVVIGWILVTMTFILSGAFLLLHNAVGDTCVAMDEWVQHPTADSALSKILPCVDGATANNILIRTKEVTYGVVQVVNGVLTNISNNNFSPNIILLYYNQTGPSVPLLCSPFNPDMTNRICTPGEVDLHNATQVWQNYVCQQTSDGMCRTGGRLMPELYNQMSVAVNVSRVLYEYAPFLISLVDCTFVRETFKDISNDHCPGLGEYSKWTYVGLVTVSTAVMLSLLFWVIYGRERRHRVYTKQFRIG